MGSRILVDILVAEYVVGVRARLMSCMDLMCSFLFVCASHCNKSGVCRRHFICQLLTKTIHDAEMRAIGTSASAPVVTVPGLACPVRNYWLFPIIVEDPNRTIKELNDNGAAR